MLEIETSDKDGKLMTQGAEGIEVDKVKVSMSSSEASVKTICLAKEIRSLQLRDLDVRATGALSDAKDRFRDARRKATEAFCNEALSTSDRVLAMQFRVMATLLEKVDNPAEALGACKVCLEELNSMSAVQKCFSVEVKQGLKSRLNKADREEIFSSVCRVNRNVYDVTRMVGRDVNLFLWPCVGKVDPLRDSRVAETLGKLDMKQFSVQPWFIGQEDEEEHQLECPLDIATNPQGHFVVLDLHAIKEITVLHSSGRYRVDSFPLPTRQIGVGGARAIATDRDDNIYLLTRWWKLLSKGSAIYVFDKHMILHHTFPLKEEFYAKLFAINTNNKVFVVEERREFPMDVLTRPPNVQVYAENGRFVYSVGNDTLRDVVKIAAVSDGCVGVLDRFFNVDVDFRFHVFSEQGDHLSQFSLDESKPYCPSYVTFDRLNELIVVLSSEERRFVEYTTSEPKNKCTGSYPVMLLVYTKDGRFVRSIRLHTECVLRSRNITVTKEGHVAMCVLYLNNRQGVLVV